MILKNRHQSLLLMLAALLCGVQQAIAVTPSILNRANKQLMEMWVESTYLKMSPQERISQIMIMAVSPSKGDEARALAQRYVEKFKVGGLIFERSDIASQATITNYAQSLASIPLMIALDAEWGLSMRLKDAPESVTSLEERSILGEDEGRTIPLPAAGIHLPGILLDALFIEAVARIRP